MRLMQGFKRGQHDIEGGGGECTNGMHGGSGRTGGTGARRWAVFDKGQMNKTLINPL